MAMRVCLEPGCGTITKSRRCKDHTRELDRARGTTAERGYGAKHRKTRAASLPDAIGKPCHFCGELMLAGQPLALDHTEDRTGYRGIVHLTCNAADGGRRSK